MSDLKKNLKVKSEIPYLDEDAEDSILNLFDETNPDKTLFNLVDDEQIRLSGSKINYFKYYSDDTYDEVYMEDRNKVLASEPIIVFGHYDPTVIEEGLENFGITATNDQLFTFNKSYTDRKLGRSPIPGDVLEPQFQKIKFRVIEVQEDEFHVYGVYHYIVTAKILRDSPDVLDNIITDESPQNIGRTFVDENGDPL